VNRRNQVELIYGKYRTWTSI